MPTVIDVITQTSQKYQLPPLIAIATAYHESGLNPQAVGDNGTSFGLYQLHEGGELGTLSEQQAFDPVVNAETAIPVIASVYHAHPDWSPGQIAAAAQRPADQAAYAASVNGLVDSQPWTGQKIASADTVSATNASITTVGASWLDGIPVIGGLFKTGEYTKAIAAGLLNPRFWIRVGEGTLGVALVILGIYLIMNEEMPSLPSMPVGGSGTPLASGLDAPKSPTGAAAGGAATKVEGGITKLAEGAVVAA